MKKGVLIFVFLTLFLPAFASADFQKGKNLSEISEEYSQNSNLIGWINLSISGEKTDSVIEADFGEGFKSSVKLLDLLESSGLVKDTDYFCNPRDCTDSYESALTGSQTEKIFNMVSGQENLSGFRFNANLNDITSVEFNLTSDIGSSCKNQVKVDFFADGSIDYMNKKIFKGTSSGEEICSPENYGCFDPNAELVPNIIGNSQICQRVNLKEAPALRIGTIVKGTGDKTLTMQVYSVKNEARGSCIISFSGGTNNQWQKKSCDTDGTDSYIEGGNYYICVSGSGTGDYQLRGESDNACGYNKEVSQTENAAFQIFAQTKKFDTIGKISTKDITNFQPNNFALKVKDYFNNKYGDLNCFDNRECVFPFKIISNENQKITLSELKAKYKEASQQFDSPEMTNNLFEDLNTNTAEINFDFVKVFLNDANLSVPSDKGDYTLTLKINGKEFLKKDISVEEIPEIKYVFPTTTIAGYPFEFTAKLSSDKTGNNTKYTWEFGDGQNKTTTTNKVEHTYNKVGIFNLKITLNQNGFDSSKTFEINATTPATAVDGLLNQVIEDFEMVKKSIENYTLFEQNTIKSVLNFTDSENKISDLQRRKATALGDSDYVSLMNDLVKLVIPGSVYVSIDSDPLIYFPSEKAIKPEIISEAGFGSYNQDEKKSYRDAVLLWNINNPVVKTTIREFSGSFEGEADTLATIVSINIQNENSDKYYLALPKYKNTKFKTDYQKKETSSYYVIELSGNSVVEFSTSETLTPENLDFFMSPNLEELNVDTSSVNLKEASKKGLLVLAFVLLGLFAFITYLVMREWYKRKYESYLFKNRNDLYNIASYIEGAKKKGTSVKEISGSLRKAGWNSEQVAYVIKKYLGKKTGMPDLPVVAKIVDALFREKNVGRNNAKS